MTDLDCIEYATQVVLQRCRKANPQHMSVPPDGATVMQWFAAALHEAKLVREDETARHALTHDESTGNP